MVWNFLFLAQVSDHSTSHASPDFTWFVLTTGANRVITRLTTLITRWSLISQDNILSPISDVCEWHLNSVNMTSWAKHLGWSLTWDSDLKIERSRIWFSSYLCKFSQDINKVQVSREPSEWKKKLALVFIRRCPITLLNKLITTIYMFILPILRLYATKPFLNISISYFIFYPSRSSWLTLPCL